MGGGVPVGVALAGAGVGLAGAVLAQQGDPDLALAAVALAGDQVPLFQPGEDLGDRAGGRGRGGVAGGAEGAAHTPIGSVVLHPSWLSPLLVMPSRSR